NNNIVDVNPATGEVIDLVPCTPLEEVASMVEIAAECQRAWSLLKATDRVAMIRSSLIALKENEAEFVELMVREQGKPLEEAREEVEGLQRCDTYYKLLEDAQAPVQHGTSQIVRTPLGVVALLAPWNFPMDEILLLALPALATGNTVVVKPSEVTPLCGAAVVTALMKGLPDGVLQVVQGNGTVGQALVGHPKVGLIAMTGSTATGKSILKKASDSLKRVVLELGGKDAMIVLDDANLEKAAHDAVAYSLSNAGQVCCSLERIYVADKIKEAFRALVLKEVASYEVGNGADPDTNVGPLVSRLQQQHVQAQLKDAIEKGASILYQSDCPSIGIFHPVVVVTDITKDMRIYAEETFGPVVALLSFDGSLEEAIRCANDSHYGLSGSVYGSLPKAQQVAQQMNCGQVGVNCYALEEMHIACPWVGHQHSGYGFHSGIEGFRQFSLPKSIVVAAATNDQD
ncbi:MAG: aldehyde dehydrogenase family protein, partial [Myxococcota bacterium]